MIDQVFSESQILIDIWKDQLQHSATENSVLNDFCYAEFLEYYTLDNNSNKTCEYQPDELDDNLIDNGHEVFWGFLPK